MLKKLLKYDLRAIFKYWWVIALSSVGVSIVGGVALRTLIELTQKTELNGTEPWMMILSSLGIILAIVGISAFLIASEIFIYIRLYKHFFSDEGYLTFTLPVKRSDLLNSKLLSGFIVNIATFMLVLLDTFVIIIIGIDNKTLSTVWQAVSVFFGSLFDKLGALSIAYIIEAVILLLCLSISSYLMVSVCITFAAIIAKKYKVFAAIGIYYLASAVLSFGGQLAMIFGAISLAGIFGAIPEGYIPGVISLMLASVTLICVALTVFMYTAELYMLDKKLNLS